MNDHCIYDLIPSDFLKRFCEVKNKITQHVFETVEKPPIYEHLCELEKLLYKIRYQRMNLSTAGARQLFTKSTKSQSPPLELHPFIPPRPIPSYTSTTTHPIYIQNKPSTAPCQTCTCTPEASGEEAAGETITRWKEPKGLRNQKHCQFKHGAHVYCDKNSTIRLMLPPPDHPRAPAVAPRCPAIRVVI